MPGTDVDTEDAINGRGLIGPRSPSRRGACRASSRKRSTWRASPWRPTGSVRTDSSSRPHGRSSPSHWLERDAGLDGRGHRARLRCRTVLLGGEADHHRQRNRDRRAATDRRRHRGEPVSGRSSATRHGAGLVAIAGVVIVVLSAASDAPTDWRGDLLAVGACSPGRPTSSSPSGRKMSLAPTITPSVPRSGWRSSTPARLALRQSLAWPTLESWGWLLLMAFGAGVLGHAVMNWSLQQIPLWLGSTFTLLVPVSRLRWRGRSSTSRSPGCRSAQSSSCSSPSPV